MGVIYLCFYVFELPRVLGITDKNVTLRVFSGSIKMNYVPNKIHFPLDISQSATERIRCHQNRDGCLLPSGTHNNNRDFNVIP